MGLGWHQLGFGFVIEQRDDGSPWIKVVDPWFNRGAETPRQSAITLSLQPYASYSEAKEIANFLNSHILNGSTPILALREGVRV